MELKNKTIIITGASGGIGKALVKRLLKENAKLILIAKTNERLKSFFGKNALIIKSNLSDRKQVLGLVNKIKKDFKEMHLLVNIAGIGIYKPIESVSHDDWDNSFAINVTAPFILVKELLPLLQKNSDSLVLNIGSGAGVIPMKNRSVYCSTKFALRGLTLSLAEEFKGRNPSFCLITLGSVLTDFGIGKALSLEEKIEQHKKGAAYFTPEWVANKLVEIIKDKNRQSEEVLYPGDYGFGVWKKP